MWKLPMPSNTPAETHLTTVLALQEEQKQQLLQIYDAYDEGRGRPTEALKGDTLEDALKAALYNAYNETQKGKKLYSVRSDLKIAAERCPFCGINPVTDLDHYLPRSKYKPLSIYVRNLIPSCGACNNKKRAIDGDDDAKRLIHAYYDVIPDEKFFFAQVQIVADALVVQFNVVQSASMSLELFSRLSYQVERLQLNSRYQAEINIFLGSQVTALEDAFGLEESEVRLRSFLQRSAANSDQRYGKNHWRTVLLVGLADCTTFCQGGFKRCLGIR